MKNDSDLPFCDLVMKGGITSGVVYPRMISRLAARYRFKSIGGTSAGAIAAGAAAAAEYRRRFRGEMHGFDRLNKLPRELQAPSGSLPHSRLFHLFQPAPQLAQHFAVLVSMLNKTPGAAVGHAVLAILRQFWAFALAGLALSLLLLAPVVNWAAPEAGRWPVVIATLGVFAYWCLWIAFGLSRRSLRADPCSILPAVWWIAGALVTGLLLAYLLAPYSLARAVLPALVASIVVPLLVGLIVAVVGGRFAATLLQGLHANGYGLCSGRTVEGGRVADEGLTDWLSGYFNELAGFRLDRPLTFGDLWGAKEGENGFPEVDPGDRQINFEVMTTAISQQMCYAIPFRGGQPLYYDPAEWSRMFPEWVMRWIDGRSEVGLEEGGTRGSGKRLPVVVEGDTGRMLRRLPANANLPVVVAVRMSLSFPLLLSAVPLYAVDRSRKFNYPHEEADGSWFEPAMLQAKRVWFSDGGISSNMPLHFFDSPLPRHPTFAANLKPEHPDYRIDTAKTAAEQEGRVYLPTDNHGGHLRYWRAPDDARPLGGLVGFLYAIIDTMQNWRDEIQFPYPAVRDRIVQISQLGDEGGLNLDMPQVNIERLSDAGEYAAVRLIERFHPAGECGGEGWSNHRRQRLRVFLGALERLAVDLRPGITGGEWNVVAEALSRHDYTRAEIEVAKACLQRVGELGEVHATRKVSLEDKAPRPRAKFRISPRI